MDIPAVIDALTRFFHEVGTFGSLTTVFMLLAGIPFILVLWRHSGRIVNAVEKFAASRAEVVEAETKMLSELSKQTLVLRHMEEKLHKMPSDLPVKLAEVCKYKAIVGVEDVADPSKFKPA